MEFLDAINRVFLKIGEQRVSSFNASEVSLLCAQNVRTALVNVAQDFPHWPWLRGIYTAQSWNLEQATLPVQVLSISFIRVGSIRLEYIPEDRFFKLILVGYEVHPGTRQCYTIIGNKFFFNPYPTTADTRNDIKFHGSFLPTLPQVDTDIIDVPTRDEDLIIIRACMLMANDHMRDTGAYQVYSAEYQRLLQTAKYRIVTDQTDQRRSAIY